MNLGKLYDDYDVLLLHSTKLQGGADGSCISISASVLDRILATINSSTTICCSSFSPGDSLRNMFSPAGLILANGEVVAADDFDLGSWMGSDCNRECCENSASIEMQVENAIKNRSSTYLNEFLVKDHKMLGIYLCLEDISYLRGQIGDFSSFYSSISAIGIEIFGIKNGNIYKINYNPSINEFVLLDKTTINNIKRNT